MLRLMWQCDENRPRCVNCTTASLRCVFKQQTKWVNTTGVDQQAHSPGTPATLTPGSGQGDGESRKINIPSPLPRTSSNAGFDQMEFLHHFCTVTYLTMTPEHVQQQMWQSTVVKIGLSFPFLMHQILAIAALHLGHCDPKRQAYCSIKATELQSQAMEEFAALQNQVDASNCCAIFLFASLLAIHVLADPTRSRDVGFGDFLDHLLGCINLVQGVRQLVMQGWESHLKDSEIGALFHIQHPKQPYDIPDECRTLSSLIENANLGDAAIETYRRTLDRLNFNFALSGVPSQRNSTLRGLLAWPMQLTPDYIELLRERRPEALIILAHYGVLLQYYRECWVVGDTGVFLIRAISAHTGRHWEPWLAWPNRMIGSDIQADRTP
jgi:Fungal specific transcription factor domain